MRSKAALALSAGVALSGAWFRTQPVELAPERTDEQPNDEPRWVQAAISGKFRGHVSGEFEFDRETFEQLIKNFRSHPSYKAKDGVGSEGVIPFDFHHANEAEAARVAKDGAPAQGWVLDLEVRDGAKGPELWALAKWLEPARTYIREGRYKWLSVAVWPNARDAKSGAEIGWYMSSIALTNDPFIQGMQPITAGYMHDPYSRPSTGEEIQQCLVDILDLPWSATGADVAAELDKLESAVRGRSPEMSADRVKAVVSMIAQLLNLPVLTEPEEIVRSAQKIASKVSVTAGRQQHQPHEDLMSLSRIAELLGISPSVILNTRADDPKSVAKLEAEVEQAIERNKLALSTNSTSLKTLNDALGTTDDTKAVAKILDLIKAADELEKLKPEIEAFKKAQLEAAEKSVDADVDAAIAAHRLPDVAKAALLYLRRSAPAEFAAKYPLPDPKHAYLTTQLTNAAKLPTTPSTPATETSTPKELAAYPGSNDLERAIAHVRAQPGGANLSRDKAFEQGMTLLQSLRR